MLARYFLAIGIVKMLINYIRETFFFGFIHKTVFFSQITDGSDEMIFRVIMQIGFFSCEGRVPKLNAGDLFSHNCTNLLIPYDTSNCPKWAFKNIG